MTRRSLVAILTAAAMRLIPTTPAAARPVWDQPRVPVYDHTGDAYTGAVEAAIAELRPLIPDGMARYDYIRSAFRSCETLRQRSDLCRSDPPSIVVCEHERATSGGITTSVWGERAFSCAYVRVTSSADVRENSGSGPFGIISHEMVHAMFGLGEGVANADRVIGGKLHQAILRLHRRSTSRSSARRG